MLLAQPKTRALVEFTVRPLFEEHGVPLAMMGVFVVFMALVLVMVFITLLPRILARGAARDVRDAAESPAAVDENTLPEVTLVVIAAAVAETLDAPHRIVKIRGLTPGELGWSMEGRIQHHRSHGVRSRNR